MISRTAAEFWQLFNELPEDVQRLAKKNSVLFVTDSAHPSLHFKNLSGKLWAARVGDHYRAVAAKQPGRWMWFWIGTHERYNKLLRHLP